VSFAVVRVWHAVPMDEDRVVATTRRCVRPGRVDRELTATAPLLDGESVLAEGVVRSRTSGLPRLSYLRISTDRICVVQHFAFRTDRLIEIPLEARLAAPVVDGSWVRIDVLHEDGTLCLHLRPWERIARRLVTERVLRCSPADLRDLLDRRV
jgi:hypothetical protein